MKKRLEKLLWMGVLTVSVLTSGVVGYASETEKISTEAVSERSQDSVTAAEKIQSEPEIETASEAQALTTEPETPPPVTEGQTQATDTEPETPATEGETKAPDTEPETPATEGETKAPDTESETPATEGETKVPDTEPETTPPTTEGETKVPDTEPETTPPATEGETKVPDTEPETTPPTTEGETKEPDTQPQTPSVEISTEEPGEIIVETVTDEMMGSAGSPIAEETLQMVKKEQEKRAEELRILEESGQILYQTQIGESIVDFYSYPAGNITENTNQIYDFLRSEMGLNHAAACGVLANIQCESNFVPTAVGDGGTSYGLCQWHLERFSRLVSWCNANGLNYHLIEGQMAYLLYELQSGYGDVYSYILNVPDTEQGAYDAAYYWCMYFEMPSNTQARSIQRGNLALHEFYPMKLGNQGSAAFAADSFSTEELLIEEETGTNTLLWEDGIRLWKMAPELFLKKDRLSIPRAELFFMD